MRRVVYHTNFSFTALSGSASSSSNFNWTPKINGRMIGFSFGAFGYASTTGITLSNFVVWAYCTSLRSDKIATLSTGAVDSISVMSTDCKINYINVNADFVAGTNYQFITYWHNSGALGYNVSVQCSFVFTCLVPDDGEAFPIT